VPVAVDPVKEMWSIPACAAQAGDDVQHAVRQAGFGAEFGDPQQRQARVLGRLDDAGIARGDRRAHRSTEDLHRVVPRHDVAGHAVRLADGQHGVTVLVGDGLAVQLVGGAGIELEVACEGGGVAAGLAHRLAGVQTFQQGQFFRMLGDDARPLVEDAAAGDRRRRAPRLFIGRTGRGDRAVDIRRRAAGKRTEAKAAGRIDHLDRGAAGRGLGAIVDEMLMLSCCSAHGAAPLRLVGPTDRLRLPDPQ
jgi:hypothetical protein